jgi:hypothetical protein
MSAHWPVNQRNVMLHCYRLTREPSFMFLMDVIECH